MNRPEGLIGMNGMKLSRQEWTDYERASPGFFLSGSVSDSGLP